MRSLRSLLFLAMLGVMPSTAGAQASPRYSADPQAVAGTTLIFPLTLSTRADLDFGLIASTGFGTVVITPETSSVTTTGLVTSIGGKPHPANFVGAARS